MTHVRISIVYRMSFHIASASLGKALSAGFQLKKRVPANCSSGICDNRKKGKLPPFGRQTASQRLSKPEKSVSLYRTAMHFVQGNFAFSTGAR